jgi:hypothetical protein
MLNKFFRIMRREISGNSFERYLAGIQHHSGVLAPTREQARKDFLEMHRNG